MLRNWVDKCYMKVSEETVVRSFLECPTPKA